ncbi:MAG: hypothetical protein RBS96_02050 [Dehalococcoidales bacterium]|jgi:hypothetical protein|nr:hypothetical protein [Dehalococcoidales bacterium]
MLKVINNQVQGTHIQFGEHPQPKRKTMVWAVTSVYDQTLLGFISWFPRFRKFSFFPQKDTVYEEMCLRDIAEFCETETKKQKERRKLEKQSIKNS